VKHWSLLDRQSYFGLTRKQLQTLYLVAATGLAALVPIIFFAGYWIQSELGKTRYEVDNFLGQRAVALSQRVDSEIERQLAALHALSVLPSIEEDASRFEIVARRVASAMPEWEDLTLAQADGTPVFSTGSSTVGDASLVRRTAERKRPLIVTADGPSGRAGAAIFLYEPVLRDDQTTHVFILRLGAAEIRSVLAEAVAQGIPVVLLDEKGQSLAQPADGAAPVDATISKLASAVAPGLLRHTGSDGDRMTTAYTRSGLTGWTTVVSIGRQRSDRLFARPVWATVAGGALALLLAGILAVFITHSMSERRIAEERLLASRTLGELDARLLATSQEALAEQQKAASEREVLLREIYHRVKNNLQIVQSLLRLGSRDLSREQREPFENAVRRIGAMARVHTLLYNSPDLASIDFRDYLDELIRELSEGFGAGDRDIESVLEADSMRMPLDTAVPLAFIAVEILTNAFKHAFPPGRSGRIKVQVHRENGEAVLQIEDDGVGLYADAATKRKLGLTIVRKLVQQIGGKLEEPPPGSSTFVIRFPIHPAAPLPTPPAPIAA
jgi:two-component sensor histidine kinase